MDQNIGTSEGCGKIYQDEVCANIQKIYDTCKDKDCLSDLKVYFASDVQLLIDSAISVRAKNAKICHAAVDLDPVPFNRGFYSVNITYFFVVDFEVYTGCGRPQYASGVCSFEKKVILFGGEGNTITFTSDAVCGKNGTLNVPTAQVEVVSPIVLGSKLVSANANCCCCCETDIGTVPECVLGMIGQDVCETGEKFVLVSLGLFSIVRIVRDVQLMLPAAKFCLPEKRCNVPSDEEPCTFFEKLSFPTGEFFPQDIGIDVEKTGC